MATLLVDDDPDILALLEAALEAFGYSGIETASSGHAALNLIENAAAPFDLMLLDIQMPSMTGIELCNAIRARPEYQFTPIIMVTAMSDQAHIDNAFAAGATDYITKPFQFEDIKHRITLAERASFQAEQLANNAVALSGDGFGTGTGPQLGIEDAIPIDDVDGVLRLHAFENYLAQMGRLEFSRTRLEILTVTNISAIFERSDSREFSDQVTDIAECVSDAMRNFAPLIAYFGRGLYCIAVSSRCTKTLAGLSADIHAQIETTGLVYRDGSPVTVEFELYDLGKRSFISPRSQVDFVKRMIRELKLAAHASAPSMATN